MSICYLELIVIQLVCEENGQMREKEEGGDRR